MKRLYKALQARIDPAQRQPLPAECLRWMTEDRARCLYEFKDAVECQLFHPVKRFTLGVERAGCAMA